MRSSNEPNLCRAKAVSNPMEPRAAPGLWISRGIVLIVGTQSHQVRFSPNFGVVRTSVQKKKKKKH